ncbi:GntR family transcriptional regulator [Telmatospirillum siberiense]|uniref:GntR family transcriptional regulator n=1 Tax=Telmatospirillum siberiense TaxID=382514 RepID=A0A2N3PTX9_9PROT|nr:GntR family transcriptional regulator [Telmatospirillum siberiense]PKU23859.1 GntR family transcriptional regulator [Telmatospirillum siberiense]
MAKTSFIQKRTMNALLDLFSKGPVSHGHASESELARLLDVSRTTIHAALGNLEKQGAIIRGERRIHLAHPPKADDYFNETQIISPQERIEQVLMERMRHGDWGPGREFSETDLARSSGVSTASVREFLIGFSRFHLVEKRPRGGWKLLGLEIEFAAEVADMRQMLELEAMKRLGPAADDAWHRTAHTLLLRHRTLAGQMTHRYKDFRLLDREFHGWILSHLQNRFAMDFMDIVSFVFYYHYKWNVDDEQFFNTAAIREHLVILEALADQDLAAATRAMGEHLSNSRVNLIRSLEPAIPA